MNRYSIIISFMAISCNRIKIVHDNEVRITEKPLQIDTSFHSIIKDTYAFDEINSVNIDYGALRPKVRLALGIKYLRYNKKDSVLHWNGCDILTGVNLIVQDSLGFHSIWNKQRLKKYFSPIETKEEALSYVYASTALSPSYDFKIKSRYRKLVDTIRTTYSIKSNNGFEINLFGQEICVCGGPKPHYMIKYRVSYEGDIRELQRIDLYEDPKEDGLCID